MNIKTIVNVMNFHSLLRVDKARKSAEKYGAMEEALTDMMRIIMTNRNLKFDNYIKIPSKNQPVLRIYLGSDYGFCGNVNTSVGGVISRDNNTDRIVVGKKIRSKGESVVYIDEADFDREFHQIRDYLVRAVKERCWSAVDLCYNHYYNVGTIKQVIRRIYPLAAIDSLDADASDDFIIEGDPVNILEDMIVEYLICETKIAAKSAYASENVMRQNVTSESLKKIDEIEEEEQKQERKRRNMISFKKTVDSSVKQKALNKEC